MMRVKINNFNFNFNKLSRGEICVANFMPPANDVSQGNYFQAKIPKMALFCQS